METVVAVVDFSQVLSAIQAMQNSLDAFQVLFRQVISVQVGIIVGLAFWSHWGRK